MCVNIDVFDIKKAKSNTNNHIIKKPERFLLNMLIKKINDAIYQHSLEGKSSCTVCYVIRNDDIPKIYWIYSISKVFKDILEHKLTDAGYQILVDYDYNKNDTVQSMRIDIRWA